MNQDSLLTREKEALLASLRSEFSVPIDVIIGYTQILLDEVSPHETKECISDLKIILQAGQLLFAKLEEILDFTSLASKKKDLDLIHFSRDLQFSLLTPLTTIIGYCEILLEDQSTSGKEPFTSDIKKILQAAMLFIKYITEIDLLAKSQWTGIDLITQFKNSSLVIREVMTSIPPLEKEFIYHPPSYKGSVLVVNDNTMARELLTRRITHYGFTANSCADPAEVLKTIDLSRFDLILLEIVMAGIGGFEILKWIKKQPDYQHIPVIVMSPLKEIDTFARCLELGADDYLTQPVNPIIFKARIAACIEKKILRDKEKEYLIQIQQEKAKSEELLLNTVPVSIAERLKRGETNIVDKFPMITIIFIDIVDFTKYAESISPDELINMLNLVFSLIDQLLDKHHLEKIKTIGDAYMAVCGAPNPNPRHAELVADFAMDVLKELEILNKTLTLPIQIRIGIHTGPVLAGIIGKKKFMYDLWGGAVNTASRMESNGIPGCIQVSEVTYHLLKDKYLFKKGGKIDAKGLGLLNTYFLLKRVD